MMTTQVTLDKMIVDKATVYAAQKGESLSLIIEKYLLRLIQQDTPKVKEEKVPEIVLSLLGAGSSVAEDDLNGREAYSLQCEQRHP